MIGAVAAAATAQMISVIPVAMTAGIAWKMSQAMLPQPDEQPQYRRPKKDVYSRENSGDFSNVGYPRR